MSLADLEKEREEVLAASIPATESLMGKYFLIQHKASGDYLRASGKAGCGRLVVDGEHNVIFHKDRQYAFVWEIKGESKDKLKLKYAAALRAANSDAYKPGELQVSKYAWGEDDDRNVMKKHEHKAKIDTGRGGSTFRIVGDAWDALKIQSVDGKGGMERAAVGNDAEQDEDSNCMSKAGHQAKFDPDSSGSVLKFTEVDITGKNKERRSLADIDADIEAASLNGRPGGSGNVGSTSSNSSYKPTPSLSTGGGGSGSGSGGGGSGSESGGGGDDGGMDTTTLIIIIAAVVVVIGGGAIAMNS